MEILKIKENIFRFNVCPLSRWDMYCYLVVRKHHSYLIDTGCGKNDVEEILKYIKENHLKKDVIVINTHYHWDHIWGNRYAGASKIISSVECYRQIRKNFDTMLEKNREYINGGAEMCLPDKTFVKHLSLDGFYFFISPGHTVDQISIYDEINKVLFVGDNIGDNETDIIPILEVPPKEYGASLKEMLHYDYDLVLSGHNKPQEKAFIRKIIDAVKVHKLPF